jgi:hypothetical protein
MSIEYSVGVAYGIIVASDSPVASAIISAYRDQEDIQLGEMSFLKFQEDYPTLSLNTSSDSWSGSITNNVIFYIEDTFKNINPRDDSYDAFYVNELEPDIDAKQELNQFAVRFGIEEEPGICIWSSIY